MTYDSSYPTKRLEGDFYHVCSSCERTVVEINGCLENHHPWCDYRKLREQEQKVELLEFELELLKHERGNVYAVIKGWRSLEGSGEDINTLKLFTSYQKVMLYIAEQESQSGFDPSYDYYTFRKFSLED